MMYVSCLFAICYYVSFQFICIMCILYPVCVIMITCGLISFIRFTSLNILIVIDKKKKMFSRIAIL